MTKASRDMFIQIKHETIKYIEEARDYVIACNYEPALERVKYALAMVKFLLEITDRGVRNDT